MKNSIWVLLFFFISFNAIAETSTFRVVHYNIRELDCDKLSEAEQNLDSVPQVKEALSIVAKLKPDILSINEIQYDGYQEPTKKCKTPQSQNGLNIKRFAKLMGWPTASTHLGLANTGTDKPVKKSNGDYYTDPEKNGQYADPVNFGLFPGQYSTGFISKLPATLKFFTHDLLWKDFNPKLELGPYRYLDKRDNPQGEKKAFNRETYQLFDKNFNHMIVTFQGKPIHVILLHTVVGGNFGGELAEAESPNELRNAEELAFLEWYLTGETVLNGETFNATKIGGISPLPAGSAFVAVGDWNIEVDASPTKPGSVILKRLFQKTQRWFAETQPTQETWNFKPTTKPRQYDYMVVSKNLKIVSSGGYYPSPGKKEKGCNVEKPAPSSANVVVAEYKKNATTTCYVEVNKDYFQARTASDHFPIWAELKFK